jgi:hypothetical protein
MQGPIELLSRKKNLVPDCSGARFVHLFNLRLSGNSTVGGPVADPLKLDVDLRFLRRRETPRTAYRFMLNWYCGL